MRNNNNITFIIIQVIIEAAVLFFHKFSLLSHKPFPAMKLPNYNHLCVTFYKYDIRSVLSIRDSDINNVGSYYP